jgi:hypothetical protein
MRSASRILASIWAVRRTAGDHSPYWHHPVAITGLHNWRFWMSTILRPFGRSGLMVRAPDRDRPPKRPFSMNRRDLPIARGAGVATGVDPAFEARMPHPQDVSYPRHQPCRSGPLDRPGRKRASKLNGDRIRRPRCKTTLRCAARPALGLGRPAARRRSDGRGRTTPSRARPGKTPRRASG